MMIYDLYIVIHEGVYIYIYGKSMGELWMSLNQQEHVT